MKVIIGIVIFIAGFFAGFFYAAMMTAAKRGDDE